MTTYEQVILKEQNENITVFSTVNLEKERIHLANNKKFQQFIFANGTPEQVENVWIPTLESLIAVCRNALLQIMIKRNNEAQNAMQNQLKEREQELQEKYGSPAIPKIYLSSKMSGLTRKEIRRNFSDAEKRVKKSRLCFIANPLHFTTIDEKNDDYETIMQKDLAVLAECDEIYMFGDWQNSDGAKRELEYAKELGLKIKYENGNA